MTAKEDRILSVLIGDGDRIVARDVELTMKRSGFNVVGTPSTTEEVLQLVEEQSPDLAILSINLDGNLDGISLANELRVSHSVPVIFLTGQSEDYVFEKARKSHPAGYVRKPFSGAELVASVEAASHRLEPDKQLEDRIPGIRSVAESLEEGVIVAGIDGRVVLMNSSAEMLTGWQEEEASGSLYSTIAPTTHLVNDNLASNEGCHCLVTDRRGRQHSVKAITTSVRSDERELLGTITILTDEVEGKSDSEAIDTNDIPGRARALEVFDQIVKGGSLSSGKQDLIAEPTEPEHSHEELLDKIDDPLLLLDRDLNVLQANPKALHTFDDDGPFMGRSFWDLFTEAEYQRYEPELLVPLREGKRHQFEFNDSRRSIWYHIHLYRSYQGVIALFHDITEERMTQAEEVRQHRLEGLGLLARGFAHDFNNHLTTVTGNLGLAKELERNPDLLEMLDEAEVASNRAAGLVQQLMTFATGGKPVRESVKITDLVRQVLTDHRMGRPSIRYKFQSDEADLNINVDRAQVRRVLENLINNAEEAMPATGGSIAVNCKQISAKDVKVYSEELSSQSTSYYIIEVVDTGCGMDFDIREKAFEPYFSSRQEDNATGIGLTVCESIADAHGGFIHLNSTQGSGTTATLGLPIENDLCPIKWEEVAEEKKQEINKSSHDDTGLDRTKYKILILEDDGPIRRLIGATLRRHGYQITETAEGGETLSAYRKEQEMGGKFDLVITDLTIENGMGGLETMRRLREMDRDVVAIVSSGYSDAAAMSNPSAFGFVEVIPKPYSPNHLKDAVDQVVLQYCPAKS